MRETIDEASPSNAGGDRGRATTLLPEERASLARASARAGRAVGSYLDGLLGRPDLDDGAVDRLAALAVEGDHAARERLLTALLPRVVAAARRYAGGRVDFADLVQEGALAVLEALVRFEPERGTPFWAYASLWVRGAMSRLAQDRRRALRLPPRALAELSRLKEAAARLRAPGEPEPSLDQVARAAGVELSRAQLIVEAGLPALSLEGPLQDGEETLTLRDVLPDPRSTAAYDEVVARASAAELGALLGALSNRERELIERRYGLGGRPEESLSAIGRSLGVSRERARQLEARALAKMGRRSEPASPQAAD